MAATEQQPVIRIRSHTSGLANLGATCYVNTVVQCLGYCPHFLKFVLAGPRPSGKPTPLVDELREIYYKLWIEGTPIVPHKFLNSLHNSFGNILDIHEQNDISEFFMVYLDKLNTDLSVQLKVTKKALANIKKQSEGQGNGDPKVCELVYQMDVHWINHVKREYSPLSDMFSGQLISQIVCGNCGYIHHNYEVHSGLTLPLPKDKDVTYKMEEVIAHYYKDEMLNTTEGNPWKCDHCKASTQSKKSTKLWKNPEILVVCLKRFDSTLAKSCVVVRAPHELDLSSYTINNNTRDKYVLRAIGNHMGSSLGSGHYACCCRHHVTGEWHTIDDAMVRPATDDEIEFSLCQGYMYFYEAVGI